MNPISSKKIIIDELRDNKFAVHPGKEYVIDPELSEARDALKASWENLEADQHLKDEATFRLRRFGLFYFLPSTGDLLAMPSTTYFQSEEINDYAGGIERNFAPLTEATVNNQFLLNLIKFNFTNFPTEDHSLDQPWAVDIHQFRIVGTKDEEGEPTPEGIHHDGDDFNVIHLMQRTNVKGGLNTVHENDKTLIASTTLGEFMDSVYVWDPYVMHGVTPIHPADASQQAVRDVLVIGYNANPTLARPE